MRKANPSSNRIDELPKRTPYPGVECWSFSSSRATVTKYRFAANARFPLHDHPEEQIVLVEEGTLEFALGDATISMRGGDWAVVEPDVPHGATAGSHGAEFVAVVVPARNDGLPAAPRTRSPEGLPDLGQQQ
jgi:mannose-6-phosphate isomerase-like protein (cupin superfamily)